MLCLVRHGLTVTIDHEGDVPIYVQLAEILRARIESGELPPRRAVPSKRMLMQEFRRRGRNGGQSHRYPARGRPSADGHRPRDLCRAAQRAVVRVAAAPLAP
jgi:hypothetical protein